MCEVEHVGLELADAVLQKHGAHLACQGGVPLRLLAGVSAACAQVEGAARVRCDATSLTLASSCSSGAAAAGALLALLLLAPGGGACERGGMVG
jgi:hypothetical protein